MRPGDRRSSRRTRALAAALTLATLALVSGASAQVDDRLDVAESTGVDTDVTPAAKESELWQQIAGAPFGETEPIKSPVPFDQSDPAPFDVSFFDVAFRNSRLGLAGGASCRDPATGEAPEPGAEQKGECRPVVYRFTHPANADPTWREVELPGGGEPGYVGAIAWIDSTRALAVGGDGIYPRREPPYSPDGQEPGEPYGANQDPAGMGRAWLYEGGGWREITHQLPPGTRGMTALDFHPGSNVEFGAAGALGQVIEWRSGRFAEIVDRNSPLERLKNRRLFQFRVREIRFLPREQVQAFGVTDGCCAQDPLHNFPRLLAYAETGPDVLQGPRWFVRKLGWDLPDDADLDRLREQNTIPKDVVSDEQIDQLYEARRINDRFDRPDSLYSLAVGEANLGRYCLSAVASPGGPQGDGERPAIITQRLGLASNGAVGSGGFGSNLLTGSLIVFIGGDPGQSELDPAINALRTTLSTIRLVASDGDVTTRPTAALGPSTTSAGLLGCPPRTGDGYPDWSVGELRSTRLPGLGSQGLALATHLRPALIGETLNLEAGGSFPFIISRPTTSELASGSYQPTTQEKLADYPRATVFKLPSYSVNAIDMIRTSGVGWAVGDHGAILGLAEKKSLSTQLTEPEPPRLGSRAPRRFPAREPYEGFRPPSAAGEAGAVPSLRQRPVEQLPEPRLIPAGAPDPTRSRFEADEDVREIVISRDGSEGWAIGPNPLSYGDADSPNATTTLYHYNGSVWSRCDFLGIEGQIPADLACGDVASLRRFPDSQQKITSVKLLAAARVPLENDDDPTNDDEFEVVAIGTNYRERASEQLQPVILRYRDGRWRFEDFDARKAVVTSAFTRRLRDVAFSAPDDGWILSEDDFNPIFHYDGERWIACGRESRCDDPEGRLRTGGNLAQPGAQLRGLVSAGDRVYAFGSRLAPNNRTYPVIVYHERGGTWRADPGEGGYDPGYGKSAGGNLADGVLSQDADQGSVRSLAVARRPDGSYAGWAVGSFGGLSTPGLGGNIELPQANLLRLGPEGRWEKFADPGALGDYFRSRGGPPGTDPNLQVVLPGDGGNPPAFIAQRQTGRIFTFDSGRQRWELLPAGRPTTGAFSSEVNGPVQAMAPDNQGGFWLAVRNTQEVFWGISGFSRVYFFHYTDRPPQQAFTEGPQPFGDATVTLTALAGAPDGSVWAAANSDLLARYDRLTGWDTVHIGGWDPGRVVTRTSEVNAIAVGPDGNGVAVGKAGRIAELSPEGVQLDDAAGTACDLAAPVPPCGTGRDLRAVAVAPDGSAIAAGDRLALLWRPAGGEFRAIEQPDAAQSTTITGVSMPEPGRAWLSTDTGLVYAGEMSADGEWIWRIENDNAAGDPLSLTAFGEPIVLRAIAVDEGGHGYAVGDQGLILERTGEGDHPWRRLDSPFLDDLTSVALPAGGGAGALIGGRNGLILTEVGGGFEVARPADYFSAHYGELTGPVVGLALLPGTEAGEVEAWAGIEARGAGTNRLLHYASDPADPLLNPTRRAEALSDSPPPREGEVAFVAFGKTECHAPTNKFCAERVAATTEYEEIGRRIIDEIVARSREPGGPQFAVFSGDAVDSASLPGAGVAENAASGGILNNGPLKLRRWGELVADELEDRGVPLLGAIGSQDLSESFVCDLDGNCLSTKQHAKAGDNLAWRQAMVGRPAPWGEAGAPTGGELTFEPVPGADEGSQRLEDIGADPDGEGPLPGAKVPLGGARTHYAVDAIRAGERVARIVVVDNSLRSLAASDPIQQPVEPAGGQTAWLERMVCFRGETAAAGAPCTREPDQAAIVVANTPTYSYGPGIATDTAADAAAFEALLLKYRTSVVVSGRLGWNGRYWATAPGVHVPCPGGEYLSDGEAPEPGTRSCAGDAEQGSGDPGQEACEAATGAGAQPPVAACDVAGGLVGLLPFVVASGGGGKLGSEGGGKLGFEGGGKLGSDAGSASEGFWDGYTIVRLDPSGDPRKTIVEQRPVLDWISIDAQDHVVQPRQEMRLDGVGREPLGVTSYGGGPVVTRYDEISSPAITHRYDLLLADPEQPWLPKLDPDEACGPYACLDPRIGTIDRTTGEVQAGNGKYPDTFALAMLSVGDHVATYPLAFKKSPSFVVNPLRLPPPAPGPNPSVPNPQAPPPPSVPKPNVPQPSLPELPALPGIPPLAAAQAPEPQLPAPPAPPPPAEQPSPLDLTVSPTALTVATPAAVIQPPTPPVNPAPPSGARREARQRQAAPQKSGADSDKDSVGEESMNAGDLANAPYSPSGSTSMTRHDPAPEHRYQATRRDQTKPAPSFTPLTQTEPTTGAQALLYAGGTTLLAALLALGWQGVRPTPRRRTPELPAPAFVRATRRR